MKKQQTHHKPSSSSQTTPKHSLFEDIQALVVASILVSFGIALFTHMNFLIGGTAGISFLIQYATPLSFGVIFFIVNIPFYFLAYKKLGAIFTFKTFIAVFCVSVLSDFVPYIFEFGSIKPMYASLLGGFLIGSGLLMLFRHNASLGGLNILSITLQEYYGISAGKFQMAVDSVIIIAAIFIVDMWSIAYSVLAAVALNLILAINHKPGYYRPMS